MARHTGSLLRLTDLCVSLYRHPLDQQNTSMLRQVPGLEMIAKNFLGKLHCTIPSIHAWFAPDAGAQIQQDTQLYVGTMYACVCVCVCVCMCVFYTGPAAEQVLLLENISTAVKVGPDQLASIHWLLIEAVRDCCA